MKDANNMSALSPPATKKADKGKRLRFLAYALPRNEHDTESRVFMCNGVEVHDVPLGSNESFLDFDGLVLCAGTFEVFQNRGGYGSPISCLLPADLDRREREFFTLLQQGNTIIFLIPSILRRYGDMELNHSTDLFRRVTATLGIQWASQSRPNPLVESVVPEFRDYVKTHGAGYVRMILDSDSISWVKPLCKSGDEMFGSVLGGRLFFLPAVSAQNRDQVLKMTEAAIPGAIAYRKRVSEELPGWLNEFQFAVEKTSRLRLSELFEQVARLEATIDVYHEHKGVLAFQSDPLVASVGKLLEKFCQIKLTINDKFIEDATIRSERDEIEVVLEIKGVKGNFTRNNVNQVDSHRERLSLPTSTPGVLIMNTFIDASSLKEKDQLPHPDIIKKAAADKVLLIRTLDLIRYADAVEQGLLAPESLRQIFLSEAGWLKVENSIPTVVKE